MLCIAERGHMRQQARTGTPAFDGARWQRCLCERLAARTGKARSHDAVHDEPARNIFQLFGHVLAKTTQAATAKGAVVVASRQFDFHTRDMIWDRAALGFGCRLFIRKTQLCRHLGDGNLTVLQGQLKLFDALG